MATETSGVPARTSAEDRALDRLLEKAPAEGALGLAALADRIAERARSETRGPGALAAAGATVVKLEDRRRRRDGLARRDLWPAVAALAASLILGVVGGASSIGEPALSALIEVAGVGDDAADAWDLYSTEPSFEELL